MIENYKKMLQSKGSDYRRGHDEPPFSDDVCFLILEYLDWREIIKTCSLISLQFYTICGRMKYRVSLPRFKLTSDEVINMGTCRTIQNATFLDISGNSGANDEAISKIKLEELKILNLSFNPIQNPGIIFEKFKNLVDLDMRGIALDRECVEIISKCDELKLSTFSFQKCDNVDDINLLSSNPYESFFTIFQE